MTTSELPIDALLPIDRHVEWKNVNEYLIWLCVDKPLKPIHTLPFTESGREAYIVLDGHHRAKASLEFGLTTIHAIVHTSDTLGDFIKSERGWWLNFEGVDTKTVEGIHAVYRRRWQPLMEDLGITAMANVPEVISVMDYDMKGLRPYHTPVNRQGEVIGESY